MYRYAEIDETIADLQQKINDAIPSQSASIVLFDVTGGQLICSMQETFFMRKDIYGMVTKIMKLKEEKMVMRNILCQLHPKEYKFIYDVYLTKDRANKTMFYGYSERGFYYRNKAVLARFQIITKKCSKLDTV